MADYAIDSPHFVPCNLFSFLKVKLVLKETSIENVEAVYVIIKRLLERRENFNLLVINPSFDENYYNIVRPRYFAGGVNDEITSENKHEFRYKMEITK